MIFELAIGRPFHANHLRRQNGEARVASLDHRLGVGNRVVHPGSFVLRAQWRGKRENQTTREKKAVQNYIRNR